MAIIITDSTCDLTIEQADAMNIEMLSLKVIFDDQSYDDKRTITSEEFYQRLKASKKLPTTSQVSINQYVEAYQKYPDEDIVVLTLPQQLSGTYQSAIIALEQVERDNIYIYDTGTLSVGLAMLIKQAVKMRDQGKSGLEILNEIKKLAARIKIYAVMDTLLYLVKGGRLSSMQGALGSIFSLKPVLTVENGALSTLARVRGFDKGMQTIVDIIKTKDNLDPAMPVGFAHSMNPKKLQKLKEMVNPKIVDGEYILGSVLGTHAGPGAVIVAFFDKE
ncbi:MAG: DegV family protein [Firmicutes bacterium]|jgi:DegV family protein with EDD domain|nr:DegV family protein [Bacillota bacterium]